MNPLEELKQEYTKLCAQLGDVLLKLEGLKSIEATIRNKINELNARANVLTAQKGMANEDPNSTNTTETK